MYEEIIPDLMIHIGSATLFEQALICILETGRSVNLIQTEINNSIASFVIIRSPSKGAYNYASRISHNLGRSRWNGVEEGLHCLQTGKGKAPMELSILKGKVKIKPARLRSHTKKDDLGKKYIRNAFGEGIPEVSMFDTTKKLRHSKMRLLEYVPGVQKSLAEKKQKYFHCFENELGEKRDDYIIATAIDGCNQGKQIGAGSQGVGKDVTLDLININ